MERFLKSKPQPKKEKSSSNSIISQKSNFSSKKDNTKEEFIFENYSKIINNKAKGLNLKSGYNNINFNRELNEEQLKIVNNIQGPMLVIAGAGSGKTRTIVYAVAKLLLDGVKPNEIMLVTFTNKAAHEMISRVKKLLGEKPNGIWAGTFHSLANRFIRKYTHSLGLKPNYIIMDETDSRTLMKISIEKADVSELDQKFPTSKMTKSILSYSINCNKSIKEIIEWKYPQFNEDKIISKLKQIYTIYRQKKAIDNLVDFDDLLVYWNKLLDERKIAQLIARNIKYVLVDEYQDTNFIQDEIIFKIVKQSLNQNIIAVGDDAQSIYSFRGANFKNILNFSKKFKGCKNYKITYNYRSVPEILALANDSIIHNKHQFKKSMKPTRSKGIKPFQVNTEDDEDQARFIAEEVSNLTSQGYELDEIGILYRAGFHSLKIELELQARNIPYVIRSGVSFFEKAHIKDILAHLRIIENPSDELSWLRICTMIPRIGRSIASNLFEQISSTKKPFNIITKSQFYSQNLKKTKISSMGKKNLISHFKKLMNFTANDDPSEVILKIIDLTKEYFKSNYSDWQDRMEDIKQLSLYSKNYQTIQQFLEFLSLNKSNLELKSVHFGNKNRNQKSLVLSTIHRAKGLEWRVIFIPMLSEGYFPSSRVSSKSEEYEEERRVFYVAVTRAKDRLYLISPSILYGKRGSRTANLSPLISELNLTVFQETHVKYKNDSSDIQSSRSEIHSKGKKNKYSAQFISANNLINKKD